MGKDSMGGMKDIVRQAQKMQKDMARIQNELKERVVEGQAGGGVVRAQVNGKGEVMGVKIDAGVVDPDDVDMLEDLVITAMNNALTASRELQDREMRKVTGGMGIPGM